MRELLFKNLTSKDKTRKDLYIAETVERDGVKTITRRHSVYIVEDHSKFKNPDGLKINKAKAQLDSTNKRHVFIFKKRDTKLKKDCFICDVIGRFFAVVDSEIYSIAFKHSFEIDFLFTKDK
ncbi:MAG: hypothetical protein KJ957_07700 [Candidatus Omnitrophica bacterium]|nr:hypothetical protein [Candidatus Omnitrophota bacterium]